ncbi:PaaI family thioesterase [Phenylobacterium sp.]|uniref:PaaI family thioesterase n=1 Tax=Phenylobacterium sp. TaxID=1871053 RepID=UPI002C416805|nr:PaaI family thioesterase [Phenylobacterium sp.]HVI33611.1 PaaI family thioesterase [Phenylobacterium sp.]
MSADPGLSAPISTGEWAGWSAWNSPEPFEDHVGPLYARREADGRVVCGFRVSNKNLNGAGSVHGGALLTFADYGLFLVAMDEIAGRPGVTVSLHGDFIAGAPLGALLTCRGEVVRAGRSLVFVRGLIDNAGDTVLSFSGVVKLLGGKPR